MKNKIIRGFVLTSIVTGAIVPSHILAMPIIPADTQEENTDISSSLRKLGAHSKLTQMFIDEALVRPNLQLDEVPSLERNQVLIKKDMNEWSSELYPNLILINSKSKGFVTKFNSYYPTLKGFVDKKEDKEGLLDRLEALQEMAVMNQGKVQRQINELTDLKLYMDKRLTDLDTDVAKAQEILSAGGTGKIEKLIKELQNTKKLMDKDLELIALLPGSLNGQALSIFSEIYSLTKGIIDPIAQTAVAAHNKGKEIDKSILEAEKKAEKESKEAGKSTSEIESAKKDAREAIEKNNQGEIAAATKASDYDLMKAIDPEKIKKILDAFTEVNKLTVGQTESLHSLMEQNQKLYDLTTKLKVADLQKAMLFLMQNDLHTFANQVDREIDLMKRYKEDWKQLTNTMTKLSIDVDATNTQFQKDTLKRLKNAINQLEEQVSKF
ncbi:HBL/NHE enterotoxin family protein [Bacillus thuringiensis]|uniref:HBL/NHE enterotoxin family protein n=1 Tax=Bacillus thuringiensis TaxID=1428 RepID=UPI000E5470EE|nr:HBL/NHE enterotoxin family protein [Bacillus thuringiensis]MDZ3952376.1 HBL/NHE enterotoxin family protein [Bacillus thuringiensis]RGP45206.1 hemolysin BL lytic component L2 [Bacillus thuringiensis]